ncbi:metal-dependent transcriptional regulator [Canibacter zhoujuaniae]|uniref:metal-dependent transcriptional regulator n=1 Tax=Canibacter zhoujuaniae TaxID=2708343 RepID=UPI00142270ED|nr:metal-dependent transcriptional regulator [Canibacter zhoujuaniae]
MTDLIDTTEMYLRTILELEEEDIVPLRARISERLSHSGPTVSQTIGRMERDGLVVVTGDRHLELTDSGRTLAVRVMRKHRLAERLLHDVIGLEWEYVHDEACRWEHVMSERVERRILELIEQPTKSPYGNPIPGLEELDVKTRGMFLMSVVDVMTVFTENAIDDFEAEIARLAEPAQVDPELLRAFDAAGIKPGARASFVLEDEIVRIAVGVFEPLEISRAMAAHIFVIEQ